MNIIIGATELLSSTKQTEEQKELTNTIQASSRGLLSMINGIRLHLNAKFMFYLISSNIFWIFPN
jgi:signal transduction histidine kinase